MSGSDPTSDGAMPFVAPCRALEPTAPLRWLRRGFEDLKRAPRQSLSYGLLMALVSLGVVAYALVYGTRFGNYWLLIGLATGFVFVAPALAMGLYEISAALERGERPTLAGSVRAGLGHLSDELVFGLMLLVVFLVWARAASMVHVFFPPTGEPGAADLIPFLAIGSAVGSIFALIIFAASAFSLPMLMDRQSDAITAVLTSLNAVLRNKPAMAVWIAIIVASVLIGFATLLVGFAITLPLIGHATWHAYRDTIDASAWPRHGAQRNAPPSNH
ncbi:MAG TPA: DUF2189 domain-containing protein [Steroidobacteraceae bacterium]|nr:DUF2189 domain-containing protein [Steroidobacteraceae bacterium]